MTAADTLPKLMLENYEKWGDKKVAMRKKEFGVWNQFTWKDLYEMVKYFSLGLISLGFEPADKLAILGENNPQWFWAELAALAAGGTATGIFSDCLPSEVKHIAGHSDSRFVVAQDQEQIDKLLQIRDELPLLEKIIYWEDKGIWSYDDSVLVSYDHVLELGREFEETHPETFRINIHQGNTTDVAVILYTSGTTGLPKGAMLSHQNLIRWAFEYLEFCPIDENDDYFSYLLPGWLTEQLFGLTCSLVTGQVMNFPESMETAPENLVELSPTILLYPVPMWERLISQMRVRIDDANLVKRSICHLFAPVGHKIADLDLKHQSVSPFWKTMNALAGIMVFQQLKSRHGLHRIRYSWAGGSLISPEAFRFLRGMGIRIKTAYAITETGLLSGHQDELDPETIGKPLPGVELSEESEVLAPEPKCFIGYYKDNASTEKAFSNGYYHTGDAGYINEKGHLVFWDRLADLKQLRNGTRFSPQHIETKLRFSPYIEDAVVTGGAIGDFVGALITIEFINLGHWMERRNIAYTTFADASQKEEVCQLIRDEIKKVNRSLPEGAKIKKFINLYKALDADEAEVTRTKKIRRDYLEQHYGDFIDFIYGSQTRKMIEMPFTYRDGRKGHITTEMCVNVVE